MAWSRGSSAPLSTSPNTIRTGTTRSGPAPATGATTRRTGTPRGARWRKPSSPAPLRGRLSRRRDEARGRGDDRGIPRPARRLGRAAGESVAHERVRLLALAEPLVGDVRRGTVPSPGRRARGGEARGDPARVPGPPAAARRLESVDPALRGHRRGHRTRRPRPAHRGGRGGHRRTGARRVRAV